MEKWIIIFNYIFINTITVYVDIFVIYLCMLIEQSTFLNCLRIVFTGSRILDPFPSISYKKWFRQRRRRTGGEICSLSVSPPSIIGRQQICNWAGLWAGGRFNVFVDSSDRLLVWQDVKKDINSRM